MQEEFIKEEKIVEKDEIEKEREIIVNIIKTKRELKNANINFEYAEDDLIDYYSYQIKAMQAKLDYLLKKAKKIGIQIDMVNEIHLRLNTQNNEAV